MIHPEIQKLKDKREEKNGEIREINAQISVIQLECEHEFIHNRYSFQREYQKCIKCEKERWKETYHGYCISEIKNSIYTLQPPIRHTDGWFY